MPDTPTKQSNRSWRPTYLLICAGLLLALHFYRPVSAGLWRETFFDASHVPIFGIIAVMLLLASPTHWQKIRRYGFALAGAIGLSGVSELLQIPTARDASLLDLAADILGATSALGITASIPGLGLVKSWQRAVSLGISATLLVVVLAPFLTVSAAYVQRERLFPILVDLDTPFVGEFVRTQHATLEHTENEENVDLTWAVRLNDGPWPGLIIHDIRPDWRDFSTLVIELGLEELRPLDINIRVHDRQHRYGDQPYRDRFNRTFKLTTGADTIRIPLAEIRDAPQGRPMDLGQIDGIVIFCHARDAGREFRIGEIRLE